MDSETYWQRRMEELERHWHDKGRQTIEKELQALYEDALDAIQDEIAALYGRFAKDNELSVVEAMQLLQGKEYQKWRMSIDAYVAQIAATGDKELEKELNVLAMRSRITRLDKLYAETLVEIAKLDQETRDKISEFLPSAYRDFYYHTLYDIGQRRGLDGAVSQVDSEQIEKVLRTPWSGKNYSARIWKNGRKLAQAILDVTVQAVHRGSSIQALSQQVSQRMGVGYRQSVRLVRTELNYVQNHAILDGIKDSGMKYYRFVATLDRRTSATCRDHDGHIYSVDDYSPGTNAPPLHPHCRSTIVGSLKGDSKPKGEQAARNESGKYTRVPADMTYAEWYQRYVDRTSTGEKIFAHHDLENGIIKADRSNVKGTVYGVNLVTSKKGGKTWNFYDSSGLQYLQVSDNDHGHKKESVFGTHGEHAHWYNVDSKGIPRHGKAVEIPEYVRKALGDQL
ncbi:minor capsid protein [Mitsuokella jalaludinii]|uniref:minor capsid protein n=1 Tax=Mitsuokella jalaludinii TaxID=187979 RepID=UPI0030773603